MKLNHNHNHVRNSLRLDEVAYLAGTIFIAILIVGYTMLGKGL